MTGARKVATLPTVDYAKQMTAPLIAVADIAGALGIRPNYLHVHCNQYDELVTDRPWEVTVQTDTVADADRLADHFTLPVDDGQGSNYTRVGHTVLQGIGTVGVRVYTGRPADDGAEDGR